MRLIGLALALTALAGAARAEDCAHPEDQASMNTCAQHAFETADARLNGAYKQLIGQLKADAGQTKLLVAAERAWIAYRDADCEFATAENAGGSMRPMLVMRCKETMTTARVAELRAYLN